MKQQFIFLDIDGTLIDYDMTLPDSAVAAIRQARPMDIG
ncbi:HAD hydrolase family protein [Aerococcaceae bacterium NML130460]|nr:HAD hydrolase family protein [Aerococcaceae bacterium NML180378]MCW6680673.1 HAD hydrolase family protein [Aerococcaceae bacterium NML130460]